MPDTHLRRCAVLCCPPSRHPNAPDGLCRRPDHAGHIEAVTPACRLWHFHHLPLARTAALTATELLHRRLQDRIPHTGGPSILHTVFPPDAWSYR